VSTKVRAWQFILLVAAVCAAAVWGVVWYRGRWISTASLLKRLPTQDAVVLYIDFEQLRQAGILQLLDGSKVGQDPEYDAFVRRTQFDYRQDLNSAIVAFGPTGKYLFARGRFDWKSLREYVVAEEGSCYNAFCKVPGSTPDRHISFFPVQSNLMAMAVSSDDSAAWRLTEVAAPQPEAPSGAIWISLPPSILKSRQNLPEGTHLFAGALEHADSVTISIVGDAKSYSARLNVRCRTPRDAAEIAAQLTKITETVRSLIAHEHKTPNPADLSGVLTYGTFRSEGQKVYGYWPIDKSFVENVFGGAG
jgi:hypothetical protein